MEIIIQDVPSVVYESEFESVYFFPASAAAARVAA
jgi:hypothetical protein